MPELFEPGLLARRRDRAARIGVERFLFDRAFDDVLDRLNGSKARRAAIVGCPCDDWPARLAAVAEQVDAYDPGPIFARIAGGMTWNGSSALPERYDLIVVIGLLEILPSLESALPALARSMLPGATIIGASVGGDSLPALRSAALAAGASPRVHPRIPAASFAPLLAAAGFEQVVVEIDRVDVAYSSFARLVGDLRGMGAANMLAARDRRPLGRRDFEAMRTAFERADGARTTERFDLVHFIARRPN